MPAPELSVVIPTRDDPVVWATIQSLLIHHADAMADAEIVIVDNSPLAKKARELAAHCKQDKRLKYHWLPGPVSSCLYKEAGIRLATGRVVIVCDSHVLFHLSAIRRLLDHFRADPDSKDLLMGPCFAGEGRAQGTNQMLYAGEPYKLPQGCVVRHGYVCRGQALGAWVKDPRGSDPDGEPFEIMQQGTGAFAFIRERWPGFHPSMTGFGGNETYLMERIRQNGGKILCAPWFRWTHDFMNSDRHNYPRPYELTVRNYLVGAAALGNDAMLRACEEQARTIDPKATDAAIRRYQRELLTEFDLRPRDVWAEQVATAAPAPGPPAPAAAPARKPIFDQYMERWKASGGDVGGSCPAPLFTALVHTKPTVDTPDGPRKRRTLEFGCGLSTIGFDRQGTDHTAIEHNPAWIDRVRSQLTRDTVQIIHAPLVERNGVTWYDWQPPADAMYDLILIDGPPGHTPGKTPGRAGCIDVVVEHLAEGGIVLIDDTHRPAEQEMSRTIAERLGYGVRTITHGARAFDLLGPLKPDAQPSNGPGGQLTRAFAASGFPSCQKCRLLAARMDAWGPAGCRERLEEIVADILPRAKKWLADEAPWLPRWLPGVSRLESAGLRRAIEREVVKAIDAAEQAAD